MNPNHYIFAVSISLAISVILLSLAMRLMRKDIDRLRKECRKTFESQELAHRVEVSELTKKIDRLARSVQQPTTERTRK